ncbi:dehydrogenase [Spirochaetia bacterium]|nr:dehydrogenase [Spirochaetia bacterium]
MKKNLLKVGIIGAGGMGSNHSECYKQMESKGVKVVAAADPDKARRTAAAALHGCKVYKTGMELIAGEDLDIVDICTPSYLHTVHALAAMDKGRAVISEKPVCLTRFELQRLLKKQRQTGADMAVAQCLRFWNEYEWLKNAADKKTYGKVRSVVMTRLGARPDRWFIEPEKSGGVILDLHIHDVDFLYYLLGEPDTVSVIHHRDKNGMADYISGNYTYADAVASVEASWMQMPSFPFTMAYRVNFEKADLLYDNRQTPALTVYPKDGKPFSPEFKGPASAYFKELDYFTDCLLNGKPFGRSTLAEVAPSLLLALKESKLAGGIIARKA